MDNDTKIRSVADYVTQIKILSGQLKPYDDLSALWFRGEASSIYKTPLVPKSYRDYGGPLNEDVFNQTVYSNARILEGNLKGEFGREAASFLIRDGIPQNGWNEYYLMQHYGLKTRLLDWSENALIALFFAVENKNANDDSTIYILSPHKLNNFTIKTISGLSTTMIYTPVGSEEKQALTKDDLLNLDELYRRYLEFDFDINPGELNKLKYYPLAVYPPLFDNRMSSQRGCFTIFGNEVNGLLSTINNQDFLRSLQIDKTAKNEIKRELRYLGIGYKSINPDLDGICRSIQDHYDISDVLLKKTDQSGL